MDYKKIYESLIDKRRKSPIIEGYFEKHHIVPRCLGGSNAKDNIVRLTAREHFFAHLLLVHIYPGPKMLFAIRMMGTSSKSHLGERKFIKSSRLFQIYREKAIKALKGQVTVRDKDGNTFNVSVNDLRYLSGELVHNAKGTVIVRDKDGNTFSVSVNDPRFLSGELIHVTKGTATVRDKAGNMLQVSVKDPRYLSGELVHHWKGKKHSKAAREKMRKSAAGKQAGSKNSQYGTRWICNLNLKQNKKISKNDPIPDGWEEGRKIKFI